MWNRPQLMKDVADLLFVAGAAALLVAAAVGVALRRRVATLAWGMDGSSSGKYGC